MKGIYLDNAATTFIDRAVLDEMIPYFTEIYGNASSQHFYGREAIKAVDESRDKISNILNCNSSEIYFTSGGTEADNWAIKGTFLAKKNKGNHIITSKIEHSAVMETCKQLEKYGARITYLDVNEEGIIDIDQLKREITSETILISVMFANNEIGTIQPIDEISKIARENKILFFTDAVQYAGSHKIDLKNSNIDMMSVSAHKFYGPKGIGLLYIRNGVAIDKHIIGGHQERKMRGGTTNVPLIVGFAKALELAQIEMENNNNYVKELRDYFVDKVEKEIEFVKYNGSREIRLENNANFSFEFIEGESLLLMLDLKKIAVSSGSACSSGSLEPSHVLLSINVPIEIAHGSVRFTFGKNNTKQEVDYVIEQLKEIVDKLRMLSPLFKIVEGEIKNV